MSYVLHIWEDPKATHVKEADSIALAGDGAIVGQNPKFIALAKALTKVYPDLDTLADAGEDLEDCDCVWVDSPMNGKTNHPVYVIGIVTDFIEDKLLEFIAHAAADQGLHVYDMQAGLLYRPDRTVVDSSGNARALPPKQRPKARKSRPKIKLTEDGARRYLLEDFARALADEGWLLDFGSKDSSRWFAWRQNGDIRQRIQLPAYVDPFECRFGVYFSFYADEIFDALRELVPDEDVGFAAHNLEHRIYFFGIDVQPRQLFPMEEWEGLLFPPLYLYAQAHSQEELEQWSARFHQWFRRFASDRFAMASDIPSLSRLADSERHRACAQHELTDKPLLLRLILAHLAHSPELESWVSAIHARFQIEFNGRPEHLDDPRSPRTKEKRESWKRLLNLADRVVSMSQGL